MCNLCSGYIRYVLWSDRKDVFRYGLLQSDHVQIVLRKYELNISGFSTIVLIGGERIVVESDAVLKIVRNLGGV